MTTLEAIQTSIAPEIDALNRRIASALSSSNKLMSSVVSGYLKSKGKQIRPIMVILTAKLFSQTVNDRVMAGAAAVEMLHNASLIHDDVIDESKLRRGMPTVNSLWDNHIAVLVGDFFVSSALQQAIDTSDLRIITSIANLGKLLSLGEIDQIYNARCHRITEKAYFEVIGRKTASLFVSCVEIGAYAVGVDDSRLDKMKRFAELLGLCFQIKDDIFDYFEDEKIGKPTGNDLREGKMTLPLLYALSREEEPGCAEMLALSHKEELNTADITCLIEYAKRAGGIEYAYATMERLYDEAAGILDTFPDHDATRSFREIFRYIITRDK